ncbi:MAG: prolyl oligopeptidase family serine peptidase [Mycobacteriaceae bacterium]|nr:prolyl oligopeptidase family serine peptidase [Mycobacteriaceae bacterium]
MSTRSLRVIGASLLLSAMLAVSVAGSVVPAAAVPFPGGQATTVFIPGADGVALNAIITAPPNLAAHRNALVIQPSGWGMPAMGSIGSAVRLAVEHGMVSIQYTARGMYLSHGEVDLFGSKDAADVSAIIDWAVSRLNVDPNRVGVAGGSYGAGMGLVAAAHDPRIKAVVVDSPPGELAAALAPNDTPKTAGPVALAAAGVATNRFGVGLTRMGLGLIGTNDPALIKALPQNRIADNTLPRLNAHRTAVFMAHDWQDSLLPPGPMIAMFDRLTGPKMLVMSPGDHSTAGGAGQVVGWPNPVWDSALRWLDHYLNGVDNGIDREPKVRIEPANRGGYESYSSVAASERPRRAYALSRPSAGVLGADDRSWTQQLRSAPTIAIAAVPYVTGTAAQLGVAPSIPLTGVDRGAAAVWHSAPFPAGARVSGTTRVALTVVPPARDLTLIGILYDEDEAGNATVITQFPITRHGLTPGAPTRVSWELARTMWNLPPGHRLALTVSSQDPIPYVSATPLGAAVGIAAPSHVDIPVG